MARFEVLGIDGVQDLIRSLTTPLASNARDGGPQGLPLSRSLLDTNIISNVTKPAPSENLVAWTAEQADGELFISSMAVAAIRPGILEKPAEKSVARGAGASVRREGPPHLGASDGGGDSERAATKPSRRDHYCSR